MVKHTEACTLCHKQRGVEDRTHVAYCRDCWNAKQREYRRLRGPRKPSETCSSCHGPRDLDQKGHPNYCRDCWNARNREYRKKNPKKFTTHCSRCGTPRIEGDRSSTSWCRECYNAWQRDYVKNNPRTPSTHCGRCGTLRTTDDTGSKSYCKSCNTEIHREYMLGITKAQYDAMVIAQNGACAICHEVTGRTLHLDHDHKTNVVRGLLCESCNLGLGKFRDDPVAIRRAAEYLEEQI
jgi:hypothetical protein